MTHAIRFTAAELDAVNTALALLEVTPVDDDEDAPDPDVLAAARRKVWAAATPVGPRTARRAKSAR